MYKARTKLACRIAGVHPDRLNEHIHEGHYKCAPDTTPGSARVYELGDILALRVFSEALKSWTMSPKLAGELARLTRRHVNTNEAYETVGFSIPPVGEPQVILKCSATDNAHATSLATSEIFFDVGLYRREIITALEEEASVLGEA